MPRRSESHARARDHFDQGSKGSPSLLWHTAVAVEFEMRKKGIDVYKARPGFPNLSLKLGDVPRQGEGLDRVADANAGHEVDAS